MPGTSRDAEPTEVSDATATVLRLVAVLVMLTGCAGSETPAASGDSGARLDVAPDAGVPPDAGADAPPPPDVAADAVAPSDASASGWRAEPRLPAVWQEIAGDVIDGRIWIVGGFERNRPSDAVRAYDPAARRWDDAPSLPGQLHHVVAAAVGGDLYVMGGYVGASFSPVAQSYVLRRGASAWAPVRPMPEARGAATAGVIGGRVVVAGGFGVSQRLLARVAIYDPRADAWTEGSAMPTPREHLASVVYEGRLWTFGGRRGGIDTGLTAVEAYDPATDAWRADLPPMPIPRGGCAAALLDGVAYVMGGERPDRALSEVDALDLRALAWRAAPPLPTPRHGFVAVATAGRVWAVGGADRPIFAAVDVVESYAP